MRSNIICDCRSMLKRLGSEVIHIFRESNRCVNLLASFYFQHSSLVVFPNLPPCMEQALFDDSPGKKFSISVI